MCIEEAKIMCRESSNPRSIVVVRTITNEIIERLSC